MNVVSLQEFGHFTGNLAFEIVHDEKCWSFIFEVCKSSCHIWYDDVFNILDHGLLIGPVLGGMGNVPIRCELMAWTAALIVADQLNISFVQ